MLGRVRPEVMQHGLGWMRRTAHRRPAQRMACPVRPAPSARRRCGAARRLAMPTTPSDGPRLTQPLYSSDPNRPKDSADAPAACAAERPGALSRACWSLTIPVDGLVRYGVPAEVVWHATRSPFRDRQGRAAGRHESCRRVARLPACCPGPARPTPTPMPVSPVGNGLLLRGTGVPHLARPDRQRPVLAGQWP